MSTKDNDPAQVSKTDAPSIADNTAQATELAQADANAVQDTAAADVKPEAVTEVEHDAAHDAKGAMAADTHRIDAAGDGTADGTAAVATVEASAEPDAAAEPEVPDQLPGELLAARRIEMRLSIEELAARVKLAPRQLTALEANDFGSLPGMATTRGFIRSCAKAMGMDPEPLLAMVAHEPNPALGPMVMRRPLPQPGFNGRRYSPSTSHRRSANKLSGLAAVVLIFVGMLAYVAWRNDWLQMPSLDFAAARDAVTSSTSAEPSPPEAAAEPAANNAAPAANKAAPVPAAPADAEVYAPSAPAPAAAGAAKAESAKAAPASANLDPARTLELKLRADSWVEVLTQNGERKLVSRLMRAGSTERIEMTEPVTLILGNAAAVDVTLRGQAVSLKSGTRDNVAKLNLK